jgi:hypothetical protein
VIGRTVSLDFYFPCYNLCFRIAARCASAQAADIIFYLQDHYKISLIFHSAGKGTTAQNTTTHHKLCKLSADRQGSCPDSGGTMPEQHHSPAIPTQRSPGALKNDISQDTKNRFPSHNSRPNTHHSAPVFSFSISPFLDCVSLCISTQSILECCPCLFASQSPPLLRTRCYPLPPHISHPQPAWQQTPQHRNAFPTAQ